MRRGELEHRRMMPGGLFRHKIKLQAESEFAAGRMNDG